MVRTSQHPGGNDHTEFSVNFCLYFFTHLQWMRVSIPITCSTPYGKLFNHAWFTMVLLAIFLILIKLSILSCLSVCVIRLLSAYFQSSVYSFFGFMFLINQSSYSCILDTNIFFLLVCVTKYTVCGLFFHHLYVSFEENVIILK